MKGPEQPEATAGPPELAGFEHRLRTEFRAAAVAIQRPAPTGAAVVARHRHRRRTLTATVAVAAAVALVTAGATVLTRAAHPGAPTVPAHTRPLTRISLYGATFPWLPAGLARLDDTVTVVDPDPGYTGGGITSPPIFQQQVTLAPVDQVDRALAHGDPFTGPAAGAYTVAVQRQQLDADTAALDHLMTFIRQWERAQQVLAQRSPGLTSGLEGVDIPPAAPRDRIMRLYRQTPSATSSTGPATTPPPALTYALYITWRSNNTNAVVVTGPDKDTVLRIGQAATAGQQPAGPADPATTLTDLRRAAATAFDGSTGTGMLDGLTNPAQAAPALGEELARHPEKVHPVRFADLTGPDGDYPGILSLSPTEIEATAAIDLPAADNDRPVAIPVTLRFVHTGTGWKVTSGSYCTAMIPIVRCSTVP